MKGRTPDKPGTFRIRPAKGGGMRLSGVRTDGRRVRMGGLSEVEANELAAKLFPKAAPVVKAVAQVTDWTKTDDWGFPLKVSDDTVASVAKTLNIPDPVKLGEVGKPADPSPKVETQEEKDKKERRAKNAKSLMDLAGIAGSAGTVMVARRITESVGKVPVKPDPKQVNDLRDSIKETLTEWFGEKEVSPWQMMFLLILGIPISMLLQSPRKVIDTTAESKGTQSGLKSVP